MPLKLASEIAAIIQSDPVMARQIKEHISAERLVDILEVRPVILEVEEDQNPSCTTAMHRYENGEILEFIVTRYSLTEILEAYRLAKRS